MNPAPPSFPCAVTIDVEPDPDTGDFEAVRRHLPGLLERFDTRGIPATLFCTSRVVDECGDLLRQVPSQHEFASHACSHRPFTRMTPEERRDELARSKAVIESLGRGCAGFRSPYFCMTDAILREVAQAGYQYDSSWASFGHPIGYHNLWKSKRPVRLEDPAIVEVPIPDATVARIPFGLSFYRAFDPVSRLFHVGRPHLVYLHCDEFQDRLPSADIPRWARPFLGRNRGKRASVLLDRLLDALQRKGARFVTVGEIARSVPAADPIA